MDQRTHDHAEILVNWSARVEEGDNVVLNVGEGAHNLGVAVAGELGEQNATVLACYSSNELQRAYLRAHDGEFGTDPGLEARCTSGPTAFSRCAGRET